MFRDADETIFLIFEKDAVLTSVINVQGCGRDDLLDLREGRRLVERRLWQGPGQRADPAEEA